MVDVLLINLLLRLKIYSIHESGQVKSGHVRSGQVAKSSDRGCCVGKYLGKPVYHFAKRNENYERKQGECSGNQGNNRKSRGELQQT